MSGVGTRNSIARAFEVSPSTVSNICKQAQPPILWDRSNQEAAARAVSIDAKVRRQRIGEGLLDDVDRLRAMLFAERTRLTRDGREVQIAPDPQDIKNLLIALGIAIDKHAMLSRFDSDDRDLSSVDAWLAHITGEGQ